MTFLRGPRIALAVAGATSFSLVGAGVLMTHLWSLAACPLCILQRMAYLAFGLFACLGAACSPRPARRLAALLAAASAAVGAGVAGYQVWIQRFAPDVSCGGRPTWWERFVYWAGERLPYLFQADGFCADPGWRLLGLSIADWSLLIFAALLGFALRQAFPRPRG